MPGYDAPIGTRPAPLVDTPESDAMLGMEAQEQEDGSVDLVPPAAEVGADLRGMPAGTNFAEHLDAMELSRLAELVLDGLAADLDSNGDHYAVLEEGIKALGIKKERLDVPFAGAAGARSSLALKSAVRFNASAMAEMMPASGPVRTLVQGEAQGIEGAAQRKAKFLNHHLTVVDEGYYPDFDQGLLLLGVLGSIFRVVGRDPITGRPRSRYRTPFNLVVSFSTSDAHGGGRYTEIDPLPQSEVRRLQVIGHWRDVDLGAPTEGDSDAPAEKLRSLEGRAPSNRYEDAEHQIYTQRILENIKGLEHVGKDGEPSGLPLPWRVVVDNESRQVLRIDRDWNLEDPALRPRERWAHFRYSPGLGFYGWGFAHLLASASDSTTTMVRQGLNANTLVSFPGGLRVKGTRMEQNALGIGPCEFREVDTAGMPIANAVMALPYRDVPPSFVPLLEYLSKDGEQLGSVAEQNVGEGRQDAPVGTTLALIEQAVRVESAVIKRLHTAQRKELRLLAALFAEDKSAVYPFHIAGQQNVPMAADFATPDDIVPVSDPNVPTQTQRLQLAQAKLTLATQNPALFDMKVALQDMLRTAGSSDSEIARLMPEARQGQPADPITEFAIAIKSGPLAVGPDQVHQAHLQMHISQMQTPGLPPPVVQALFAHCGDHLIAWYRAEFSRAFGIPLPPLGQPLPPQIEAAISVRAAQSVDEIAAKIAPVLAGAAGGDPGKAAEIRLKERELAWKATEAERKAQTAREQEAGEAARATLEHQDAEASRRLKLAEMEHDERMAAAEAEAGAATQMRAALIGGLGGPVPVRGGR